MDSNDAELIHFAGTIFTFPVDKRQVEIYLSNANRTVFKVVNEEKRCIGIAEISILKKNNKDAKLARILIGEKTVLGKGIGTKLIKKLTEFGFKNLKNERIILNGYSWNGGVIKCYEKVGFSRTDKSINYVKVGNDYWKTIEMEKIVL
ncbi:GNAT family N-acetyltransferase [Gelidibacter mesophilus]|uniref:GNAT family N-acetyltransferase n=1 Tax=Gelidibacter mesophilus TaxID=169050 RepID=UPI0004830FED|nr:GNAT family N-acetyltransferase [Gelidibacter mesophilus]